VKSHGVRNHRRAGWRGLVSTQGFLRERTTTAARAAGISTVLRVRLILGVELAVTLSARPSGPCAPDIEIKLPLSPTRLSLPAGSFSRSPLRHRTAIVADETQMRTRRPKIFRWRFTVGHNARGASNLHITLACCRRSVDTDWKINGKRRRLVRIKIESDHQDKKCRHSFCGNA
jgi:hypothetical protein